MTWSSDSQAIATELVLSCAKRRSACKYRSADFCARRIVRSPYSQAAIPGGLTDKKNAPALAGAFFQGMRSWVTER